MAAAPRISETLIELADTIVSDYDLLEYLHRLLDRSVEVLGADAGGVMLSPRGAGSDPLQLLACTDENARVLELFELQRQEGPCVDAHRNGMPVVEHDLAESRRWPSFSGAALEHGFRAVYAFPLRLRSVSVGALNLFRQAPGPADDEDVVTAQAFADMAAIGILQNRALQEARDLAGHLQIALNSRVIVEQAKGILAERLGYDMEHAYQAMRWYGRDNNLQLRVVAAAVVDGELSADALRPRRRGTP